MKRSKGVTVFAILFITGNLLFLLSRVPMLRVGVPWQSIAEPGVAWEFLGAPLIDVVLTLVALVSAFALLRLKLWARWVTIGFAVYDLTLVALTFFALIFSLKGWPQWMAIWANVVLPMNFLRLSPKLGMAEVFGPYISVFFLFWDGLIIWYFLRPSVKAQFQKTVSA